MLVSKLTCNSTDFAVEGDEKASKVIGKIIKSIIKLKLKAETNQKIEVRRRQNSCSSIGPLETISSFKPPPRINE